MSLPAPPALSAPVVSPWAPSSTALTQTSWRPAPGTSLVLGMPQTDMGSNVTYHHAHTIWVQNQAFEDWALGWALILEIECDVTKRGCGRVPEIMRGAKKHGQRETSRTLNNSQWATGWHI